MRMANTRRILRGVVAAAAVLAAHAGFGQQGRYEFNELSYRGQNRPYQNQPGQYRSEPYRPPSSAQAASQANREAWVLVGYDFDHDRQVDAWEYIAIDDLDQARRASRQRRPNGQPTPPFDRPGFEQNRLDSQPPSSRSSQQDRFGIWYGRRDDAGSQRYSPTSPYDRPGVYEPDDPYGPRGMDRRYGPPSSPNRFDQPPMYTQPRFQNPQRPGDAMRRDYSTRPLTPMMQQARQSIHSVQGEIDDAREIRLATLDEPHLLAKIETDNNRTVPVDLGPVSRMRSLDLREGDRVLVSGTTGTINDRPVLMAELVNHEGRSMRIDRVSSPNLNRIDGRIIGALDVPMRGETEDHLLAKVRTDDGRIEMIDLGTESQLGRLSIRTGNRISVLASPARIDGNPAWAAQRVSVNGEAVTIERNRMSGVPRASGVPSYQRGPQYQGFRGGY